MLVFTSYAKFLSLVFLFFISSVFVVVKLLTIQSTLYLYCLLLASSIWIVYSKFIFIPNLWLWDICIFSKWVYHNNIIILEQTRAVGPSNFTAFVYLFLRFFKTAPFIYVQFCFSPWQKFRILRLKKILYI